MYAASTNSKPQESRRGIPQYLIDKDYRFLHRLLHLLRPWVRGGKTRKTRRDDCVKLDTDLVRKILLHIEANEEGEISLDLPDYSQDEVYQHVEWMKEAGFVDADIVSSGDGTEHEILYCEVHKLTLEGHAFLKNARNHKLLERAKKLCLERTGVLSLDLLKDILIQVVKNTIKE